MRAIECQMAFLVEIAGYDVSYWSGKDRPVITSIVSFYRGRERVSNGFSEMHC